MTRIAAVFDGITPIQTTRRIITDGHDAIHFCAGTDDAKGHALSHAQGCQEGGPTLQAEAPREPAAVWCWRPLAQHRNLPTSRRTRASSDFYAYSTDRARKRAGPISRRDLAQPLRNQRERGYALFSKAKVAGPRDGRLGFTMSTVIARHGSVIYTYYQKCTTLYSKAV